MARTLADHGCGATVALAEAGTLPYLARLRGERAVAISARATRLPTGIFAAERSDEVLPVLRRAPRDRARGRCARRGASERPPGDPPAADPS